MGGVRLLLLMRMEFLQFEEWLCHRTMLRDFFFLYVPSRSRSEKEIQIICIAWHPLCDFLNENRFGLD